MTRQQRVRSKYSCGFPFEADIYLTRTGEAVPQLTCLLRKARGPLDRNSSDRNFAFPSE